jgi:hypothetical protein
MGIDEFKMIAVDPGGSVDDEQVSEYGGIYLIVSVL